MLRKKHTVKLVDRKGSGCDPFEATYLQIESTTTQIDSHWATSCTDLLQQIRGALKSNSIFAAGKPVAHAQANCPAEKFQTPKKRTLRDLFSPATPSRTPSTPETSAAPSELVTPLFGSIDSPNETFRGFEERLSQFVELTARQQGISATGALDRILYATRGAEVSTSRQTLPLPPIPPPVKEAINALLGGGWGVGESGESCQVQDVCRAVG